MQRRPETLTTYDRALEAGFPQPQILLARMGQCMQRGGYEGAASLFYEEAIEQDDLPQDHVAELQEALSSLNNVSEP